MVSAHVSRKKTKLSVGRFPFYANIIGDLSLINYAPIIIAGVTLLGVLYYVVYAHKHYLNPAPDEHGNFEE
jgi:hypothetical protein